MTTPLSRRRLIAGAAALGAAAALPARAAETRIDLTWADLIPEGDTGTRMSVLRQLGIVEHGDLQSTFDQGEAAGVVTDYNGKRVRIPGYAVPIDFDGTAVASFILVPYVGACIHVPPPPPNQLVFVQPETPFEVEGMWDPIYATGVFTTMAVDAGIAEIGYAMSDARIEPYTAG